MTRATIIAMAALLMTALGCGAEDNPDDDEPDAAIVDAAVIDALAPDAAIIDAAPDALVDAGGPCTAFQFDCPTGQLCVYQGSPSRFACHSPPTMAGIAQAPNERCLVASDCGESQGCLRPTGAGAPECYLFCYLSGSGAVGASPNGRFPANGTCTVGLASYGTCTDVGLGGGYGVCL